MRCGTTLAWSRGNSGMRRVARSKCCGVSKVGAALKVPGACGGTPKLTIASAHVAMTFPSAPTVSVVVLCCGNEYPSEKLEQHNLAARVRNTCDRGAGTVPANAQPRGPNYSVENAETVAAGKDLRVRILVPGIFAFGSLMYSSKVAACPWRTNREHTAAGVKPESASFALPSRQNLQSAEN
jgi:hypothetical protein